MYIAYIIIYLNIWPNINKKDINDQILIYIKLNICSFQSLYYINVTFFYEIRYIISIYFLNTMKKISRKYNYILSKIE